MISAADQTPRHALSIKASTNYARYVETVRKCGLLKSNFAKDKAALKGFLRCAGLAYNFQQDSFNCFLTHY